MFKTISSFDDRNDQAKQIHFSSSSVFRKYALWDVVIVSLWCNIGSEQDGKTRWSRPCVILRISWSMIIIAPLTTKHKPGNEKSNIECHVWETTSYCLINHMRSIDIKRIQRKIWSVSKEELWIIKNSLRIMLWF